MKIKECEKYKLKEYELSTGKTFAANHLIIGINPDLEISEGYDGGLDCDGWEKFTAEERKEIAEYMIELWKRWGVIK